MCLLVGLFSLCLLVGLGEVYERVLILLRGVSLGGSLLGP